MVTKVKAGKKGSKRRSKAFAQAVLGKPSGIIQPRVQEVGPEHFGIVSIDCAKARSKWMFTDFYGRLLVEPTEVEHQRNAFQQAIQTLKLAIEQHGIKDTIVCVEMTGSYHLIVMRAFRQAGFETRIVHPFASSHYRAPEHGDIKTDDHDLIAIFRAAVNGFGLVEPTWSERDRTLQLLVRHRRDLVAKRAKLQVQIRYHLERCLPGYAGLFPDTDLWDHPVGLALLRFISEHGGTHRALLTHGIPGVTQWLKEQRCGFQTRTVGRVVAWAANAADGDPLAPTLTRIWQALLVDWHQKADQIRDIERDTAGILAQTPWILLLSHPGINIISAAELAGETGPIEFYASAKAITGRAGLFPSRYQSDGVDRGGNLSRFRNGRMRVAWLLVADNLIKCNHYWQGKYALWKSQGADPRDLRCRIANRITRTIFQMVAGRKIYQHPSRLDRGYVLKKLLEFHREHDSKMLTIQNDLHAAASQLPRGSLSDEVKPILEIQRKASNSRKPDPQQLGSLLVHVLARLGVTNETPAINSTSLEAPDAETGAGDR
jgi:transposase